ncbi:hypothetical protein BUALT_Bualt03G0091200 [Buddleja alternifolia]|uniref:Uncharacterized protein n=1 Tax=Buddleja alternifolia TaxID=168488 RepID=A0AAV6XS87_9LAMI|nr:hypothetical protein BUALT_Bualt03G0091200 [Buddleja alternifolia]
MEGGERSHVKMESFHPAYRKLALVKILKERDSLDLTAKKLSRGLSKLRRIFSMRDSSSSKEVIRAVPALKELELTNYY